MRRACGADQVGIYLVSAIIAGCAPAAKPPTFLGKLVPVTGVVKIDGEPAAGVEVAFLPASGIGTQNNPNQGQRAVATTDEEGEYSLITPPGGTIDLQDLAKYEGALPGKYDATFSLWVMPDGTPWAATPDQKQGPMAAGATAKLPPQLADPRATPHKVDVKADGSNTFNFDLKTK